MSDTPDMDLIQMSQLKYLQWKISPDDGPNKRTYRKGKTLWAQHENNQRQKDTFAGAGIV